MKNFGQCGILFRSGELDHDDGIQVASRANTIINVAAELDDSVLAREWDIDYISLPLKDKEYPPAWFAEKFLSIIRRPGGPYLVHCKGGRHRTGAAVAIYRISECGWTFDQAWEEMKKFGFTQWGLYVLLGHKPLKDFVRDFAEKKALDVG